MLRIHTNSLQLLQLRRIAYTFQSPFLAPFGKLAPPNAYPVTFLQQRPYTPAPPYTPSMQNPYLRVLKYRSLRKVIQPWEIVHRIHSSWCHLNKSVNPRASPTVS